MATDYSKVVESILDGEGWDAEWDKNYEEVEDPYVYIIGLDPGETTGFAIVRLDPRDKKALPELLFLDQVPGGRYGFKNYFSPYTLDDNIVLVSEQWKELNKKGVDREPQYIEGSMHMLWGDENIVYQTPDMKALVPDEFLIEQGVWTPGKRHQMDALIHILVYLRNGGEGNEGVGEALGGEGEGAEGPTMGEISQFGEGNGEGQGAGEGDEGQGFKSLAQSFADYDEYTPGEGPGGEYTVDEGEFGHYTGNPEGRSKRELDGAFMGFVSDQMDKGTIGATLLDD